MLLFWRDQETGVLLVRRPVAIELTVGRLGITTGAFEVT